MGSGKMTEERKFKEDVKVSRDLESEWEKQASLYMYYSEQWADAVFERDKLKEQLDVTRAEADKEIRDSPEEFGLSKVTESAISAAIVLHDKVREAILNLNEANRNMNILSAAREAMAHKKKALEMLVNIRLSGNSAEPKVGKEFKEEINEKTKEGIRKTLGESDRLRRRRNK